MVFAACLLENAILVLSRGGAFASFPTQNESATSFPGFSPTRLTERVGENPGNEVEMPGGMGTLLIY